MLVIAHVTDTHFGNQVRDPAARNAAVLDHLLAMEPRPDVLVVSGDVADHGLPEEYAEARAWLDRWDGPLAVCPGNHDVRDAFVAGLGIGTRTVVDAGGSHLVMLDSLIDADATGRIDHGRLGSDQLAWLDTLLAEDPRPTYVCLQEMMDAILLVDGAELEAVVARHPHVAAVLVGHAHTMVATTFAGRPLLIGGGVVSAVSAEAEAIPSVWYDAPPTFALHLVDDAGRITTHWRALPGPGRGWTSGQ